MRQGSRLPESLISRPRPPPQLRHQTGIVGCSWKPMSLEFGLGPPIVPGRTIRCSLGPGTVPPSLLLPAWAPVPQSLGLYLLLARLSAGPCTLSELSDQGLRLLWAATEEGAQPCQEPVFSGSISLAMETDRQRPGNYPDGSFNCSPRFCSVHPQLPPPPQSQRL